MEDDTGPHLDRDELIAPLVAPRDPVASIRLTILGWPIGEIALSLPRLGQALSRHLIMGSAAWAFEQVVAVDGSVGNDDAAAAHAAVYTPEPRIRPVLDAEQLRSLELLVKRSVRAGHLPTEDGLAAVAREYFLLAIYREIAQILDNLATDTIRAAGSGRGLADSAPGYEDSPNERAVRMIAAEVAPGVTLGEWIIGAIDTTDKSKLEELSRVLKQIAGVKRGRKQTITAERLKTLDCQTRSELRPLALGRRLRRESRAAVWDSIRSLPIGIRLKQAGLEARFLTGDLFVTTEELSHELLAAEVGLSPARVRTLIKRRS